MISKTVPAANDGSVPGAENFPTSLTAIITIKAFSCLIAFVEHTISRRAFKLSFSNVSAELYRYSAFNVARTSIALFCLSPTSAVNFRDI